MGTTATARPDVDSNYRFDLDLPESDIRDLIAGVVPPSLQQKAAEMLAWKDETHPIRRAYARSEVHGD